MNNSSIEQMNLTVMYVATQSHWMCFSGTTCKSNIFCWVFLNTQKCTQSSASPLGTIGSLDSKTITLHSANFFVVGCLTGWVLFVGLAGLFVFQKLVRNVLGILFWSEISTKLLANHYNNLTKHLQEQIVLCYFPEWPVTLHSTL